MTIRTLNLKDAAELLAKHVDGDLNDEIGVYATAVVQPISVGCVELVLTLTDAEDGESRRTFRATMIEDVLNRVGIKASS